MWAGTNDSTWAEWFTTIVLCNTQMIRKDSESAETQARSFSMHVNFTFDLSDSKSYPYTTKSSCVPNLVTSVALSEKAFGDYGFDLFDWLCYRARPNGAPAVISLRCVDMGNYRRFTTSSLQLLWCVFVHLGVSSCACLSLKICVWCRWSLSVIQLRKYRLTADHYPANFPAYNWNSVE